jgi:hypothetical protein
MSCPASAGAATNTPKPPAGPAGWASIFFEGERKGGLSQRELANNFPANADLEETAVHGPGE